MQGLAHRRRCRLPWKHIRDDVMRRIRHFDDAAADINLCPPLAIKRYSERSPLYHCREHGRLHFEVLNVLLFRLHGDAAKGLLDRGHLASLRFVDSQKRRGRHVDDFLAAHQFHTGAVVGADMVRRLDRVADGERMPLLPVILLRLPAQAIDHPVLGHCDCANGNPDQADTGRL